MDTEIFTNISYCIHFVVGSLAFQFIFACAVAYLAWRMYIWIYFVATSESGIHYVENKRQCLRVFNYKNPFSFQADYIYGNLTDGIECTMLAQKFSFGRAFWGLAVDELLDFMNIENGKIRFALLGPWSEFARQSCLDAPFCVPLSENVEVKMVLKPNIIENILHPDPNKGIKKRYPLVVVMVLSREAEQEIGDSVVVMAYMLHIYDGTFPLQSQLIAQYAKLSNGRITRIKKIFGADVEIDDEEDLDSCAICYQRPASVVCLPCRHECVCNICFVSCERCPMCRALVPSFFETSTP